MSERFALNGNLTAEVEENEHVRDGPCSRHDTVFSSECTTVVVPHDPIPVEDVLQSPDNQLSLTLSSVVTDNMKTCSGSEHDESDVRRRTQTKTHSTKICY